MIEKLYQTYIKEFIYAEYSSSDRFPFFTDHGLCWSNSSPLRHHSRSPGSPCHHLSAGFWQPVGRFDPKKPVKVKLVNKTDVALDYDISNLESFPPASVAPGETVLLENFGDNAYIMVYPENATPSTPEQSFLLKFTVPVDARTQMVGADNVAVITVTKGDVNIEERFYGHRSINLQPTGAIFFY